LLTAAMLVVALAAISPNVSAAPKAPDKTKKLDLIWQHPEFPLAHIRSIALLPAATYNADLKAEKDIEQAWGQAFRPLGHRWYSSTLAKDLLQKFFGGDSVLKTLRTALLKEPRVDSLSAIALCRALRVNAVMSVRADLWEKTEMEWNQTGNPWTTVQLKAALVDSSGRLLWTASGSETREGPLHQADANTLGVKSSGLNLTPVTGQGGAPSFAEVLSVLLTRWTERFPRRDGAAPAAAPGASADTMRAVPPAGGGR
jgi:hypothetical protein